MKNIAFLGNCQAEALSRVYQRLLAPLVEHRAYYVDATYAGPESLARLAEADIVVVQQFDVPPAISADNLKVGAVRFGFPSLVATFYWPYGRTPHPRNASAPELPSGPYDPELGDSFLNRQIKRKKPVDVALAEYLALDVANDVDLSRMFDLALQRARARDDITGISTADFIEENFRDKYLFRTIAHPNLSMFRHLAAQIYTRLGAGDFLVHNSLARLKKTPFPSNALPIHPAVIKHFELKFANESTQYEFLYEGSYTFEQFCLRYLRYEWNEALQQGIYLTGIDPEGALTKLNVGLSVSPESIVGLARKSYLQGRLGQHDVALQTAERAVAVAPEDVDALLNLSSRLIDSDKLPNAKNIVVNAINIDPHYAPSYLALADIYLKTGEANEAVQAAREAEKLAPGEPHIYSVLAGALASIGDLAGAEHALERVRDLTPMPMVAAQDQSSSEEEGEPPSLEALRAQGSGSLQIKSQWVHVLRKANKINEAEEVLRELVREAPEVQDFQHLLADVLQMQGAFDEAIQIMTNLVATYPDDPRLHHTLGHALSRSGELREAAAAFRRAMELNPSEKDYERCLAMLSDRVM